MNSQFTIINYIDQHRFIAKTINSGIDFIIILIHYIMTFFILLVFG